MQAGMLPFTLSDPGPLDELTIEPVIYAPVNAYRSWIEDLSRLSMLRDGGVSQEARSLVFETVRDSLRARAKRGELGRFGRAVGLTSMLTVASTTGRPFSTEDLALYGGGNDMAAELARCIEDVYSAAEVAPAGPVAFSWIARGIRRHPGVLVHASERVRRYFHAFDQVGAGRPILQGAGPPDRVFNHLLGPDPTPSTTGRYPLTARWKEAARLALGGHAYRLNLWSTINLVAIALIATMAVVGSSLWLAAGDEIARFDRETRQPLVSAHLGTGR